MVHVLKITWLTAAFQVLTMLGSCGCKADNTACTSSNEGCAAIPPAVVAAAPQEEDIQDETSLLQTFTVLHRNRGKREKRRPALQDGASIAPSLSASLDMGLDDVVSF
mmetsp:Transcript_120405/g.234532  ORF Transcript_120405/g.234532 Transcript_120405/m.234532 type:complete len:108 (+) Transcript_120405:63-386(+)